MNYANTTQFLLGYNNWTIEMWINITSVDTIICLADFWTPTTVGGTTLYGSNVATLQAFGFLIINGSTLQIQDSNVNIFGSSQSYQSIFSSNFPGTIPLNTWVVY